MGAGGWVGVILTGRGGRPRGSTAGRAEFGRQGRQKSLADGRCCGLTGWEVSADHGSVERACHIRVSEAYSTRIAITKPAYLRLLSRIRKFEPAPYMHRRDNE